MYILGYPANDILIWTLFLVLASLSTSGLIMKVKELHDIAYKLGVEESREMTRGQYLDIFNKNNNKSK